MKLISTHGLSCAAILFALQTSCGQYASTSSLHDTTNQNCADLAKKKHDNAYADAAKAFEAEAAACYVLMDDNQYLPASLCLKKADARRKEMLLDADAALSMDMSQCRSRS